MTVNSSRSRRARSPTNLAELIQSPSPSSKYQHQWQTSGTVGTTLSKSTVALHLIWPRIHISLRHVVFEIPAQRAEEITSENSEVDSAWALAAATAPTPRTQPRRTAAIQPRVSSSRSPRAGGYRSAVLTADHWFRPGFAMQFLPSAWRSSLATIGATAAPVRQASATATSPAAAVEPASAKHPCPVAARWH